MAFDELKQILSDLTLLCFPDSRLPCKFHTDASDECIGTCLTLTVLQEGQGYLSYKLSDTQIRWSTFGKEAYVIYITVSKT